jgi:hypothetical protein
VTEGVERHQDGNTLVDVPVEQQRVAQRLGGRVSIGA